MIDRKTVTAPLFESIEQRRRTIATCNKRKQHSRLGFHAVLAKRRVIERVFQRHHQVASGGKLSRRGEQTKFHRFPHLSLFLFCLSLARSRRVRKENKRLTRGRGQRGNAWNNPSSTKSCLKKIVNRRNRIHQTVQRNREKAIYIYTYIHTYICMYVCMYNNVNASSTEVRKRRSASVTRRNNMFDQM